MANPDRFWSHLTPEQQHLFDEARRDASTLSLPELQARHAELRRARQSAVVDLACFTRASAMRVTELNAALETALTPLRHSARAEASAFAVELANVIERTALKRRTRLENFVAAIPTAPNDEQLQEWLHKMITVPDNEELLDEASLEMIERLSALRDAARMAITFLSDPGEDTREQVERIRRSYGKEEPN
jgi:hypothetical protein